jgi:hypothetical protein
MVGTAGHRSVLKVVRKVKLGGRVTSAISGKPITSPAIALARLDAGNNGTLVSTANARYLPGGVFEIRDVTARSIPAPGDGERREMQR